MGEELVVHDINWENRQEILKELALQLLVPERKTGEGKHIFTAVRKMTFLAALNKNNG